MDEKEAKVNMMVFLVDMEDVMNSVDNEDDMMDVILARWPWRR